jgi:hypothetical protein
MTASSAILVLLHVPRTGGTSLHQAFSARFAPEEICPERMNRLETLPAEEVARHRLFSGHHRFEHLALMPAPRLAVTVLREPRARLVSLYRHWRRHWAELAEGHEGLRLAQALSLREFLRCDHIEVAEAFDNAMARQLAGDCRARAPGRYTPWAWEDMTPVPEEAIVAAACRNLERLDAVGFADALDALHGFVAARMGWTVHGPLPRLNGQDQPAWGVHALPREELPPEAMEEIERMTRLDRQLWEFARARAAGAPLWRPG